ncbi:MAG TPA: large-conductance mechanosensitive channel protein MscL [Clostridia bacterium]|jgi:large conductance mechanosensitive channel|nr:MAG: Large-conductance mechanosensitive channel [Firmicutes bacterium ADurb.Bin099]HNZ40950.1 large-conductance mechanosensitive channel protein MscL [Clostridia bacterium]HPY98078.1 large-conductance mechanosensitive channel protein MscL [Clostridia bacterium]HQC68651.1 large-conductance mechanosensitive channel protein MscL [Clostridia bacterium]
MAKKNKTNLLSEFKAFITKGNVIDMAVGVIIGAAFGKIVSSFVNDILMPLIGLVMGKVNFHDLKWVLATDAEGNITSSVNYGTFLQGILDFLIIAACVFLLVRLVALVRSKAEEAKQKQKEEVKATPPAPSKEQVLLTEIRDLLKEKK